MKKEIKDPDNQRNIINHLLDEFKQAVLNVAHEHDHLTVIDTQGTVDEDEWRNEIHPNSSGFGKIAEKIYTEGLLT